MKVTARNLVHAINRLSRDVHYNYINPTTPTKIIIDDVVMPEGPITIRRYNPYDKTGPKTAKKSTISTQMIWRVANSIVEHYPINLDRILGGSYNTRSALETLLAHTSEFYWCLPGRIESLSNATQIKRGHKHLVYEPNQPHDYGVVQQIETNIVISEIPTMEAVYDSLILPEQETEHELDIEVRRRHAQIQIALLRIGLQLGSRVWIAQNDRGIQYKGTKITEMEGVIESLTDVQLLSSFSEAIRAARMIDLVWFRNSRFMPAVFEIEHTTGITSGLTRMKNLKDNIPPIPSRWVVVAQDDMRDQVMKIANQSQFREMSPRFMPYTAVEELYSLCQRRNIKGVQDEFLDSFMENCIVN